jgi:hypothetical protein
MFHIGVGCWLWTAYVQRNDGVWAIAGWQEEWYQRTRLAYELCQRPNTGRHLELDHLMQDHSHCVNPEHLRGCYSPREYKAWNDWGGQ